MEKPKNDSHLEAFAGSLLTIITISCAVTGWLTKTYYSGNTISQIVFRFFIFFMGAVGLMSVVWIALYALVTTLFRKNLTWVWGVLCIGIVIISYLIA